MNEKYTYRFDNFFLYIFGIIFFALGSIALVTSINSFIQGKPISLLNFIKNFVVVIFFPILIMCVDFLETDIHVDEHGLNLKSLIKTFRVSWEDVIERFLDNEGSEQTSKSIVYVDRPVDVDGYLYLGVLNGVTNVAAPKSLSDAWPIRQFMRLPELRNRQKLKTAYL